MANTPEYAVGLWAAVAIAAGSIAAWLTGMVVGWASSRGILDHPNSRSSHARPTPRGGGLAIVAVTTIAAMIIAILLPSSGPQLAMLLLPALAVAAISWRDDIRPLSTRTRLLVHVGAAAIAVGFFGPVERVDLGRFGIIEFGVLGWPLTMIWVVGLTNAFNFMDGIDGIAGITAAATGVAVALMIGAGGETLVAMLPWSFAAAAVGFLSFNWSPARIFMGDVGSAFCGFLLAVLPLAFGRGEGLPLVLITFLTLWPFIFDTGYTLIKRIARRENVLEAHRGHLYQRLVIAGWSHRRVASLYGLLAAVGGGVAIAPLVAPVVRPVADAAMLAFVLTVPAVLVGLVGLVGQGYNPASQGLSR